jgi:hypothetical protein
MTKSITVKELKELLSTLSDDAIITLNAYAEFDVYVGDYATATLETDDFEILSTE